MILGGTYRYGQMILTLQSGDVSLDEFVLKAEDSPFEFRGNYETVRFYCSFIEPTFTAYGKKEDWD